jgi:hypothetical protein
VKPRKYRAGSWRPIRSEEELMDRMNQLLMDGFDLENDLNGEILYLSLAPNESKIIPHGLRVIPKFRIILRQTGNAVITDIDAAWTEFTIGLKNESANAVTLTIKLLPG